MSAFAFRGRGGRGAWVWLGGALALLGGLAFVYRPLLAGRVLAGRDVFRLFIPDASFLLECLRRGELPLWNPYQRLGQPFAATLYSQAFYPPRWLALLLSDPVRCISWEQVLHAALATTGTVILCRRLGASLLPALAGGVAFGLGPMLTHLGVQQNVVDAAAWTPWMLLAARGAVRHPSLRGAAWLAGTVALSFLAGSPETLLWQLLLVSSTLAWARPRRRSVLALLLGSAWGGALAAMVAFPAIELASQSTRVEAHGDVLRWSLSPLGALSMGLFQVDLPRGGYWGEDQGFVPSLFLGTLVCGLAMLALGRRPGLRGRGMALGLAALLLTLLAMGAHFPPAGWLLRAPGFNLFRYPAKYAVGAGFCIAVLASLGLERLGALAHRVRPSRSRAALAVACGLIATGGGVALARVLRLRAGVTPALLWAGLFLTAAALLFFVAGGGDRSRRVRGGAAFLVVVELLAAHWLLGMPWWLDAERLSRPSALAAHLPRPFPGRLSVDLAADRAHALGEEAFSYVERSRDALVPLRFLEEGLPALEGYGAPEPRRLETALAGAPRGLFDLAGVSYYVRRGEPPFDDLKLVAAEPGLPRLYASATALPRVFVLHDAVPASDAEALAALRAPGQPTRHTVFLAEGEPLVAKAECASTATVQEERLRELSITVEACAEGFLVVADAYYPGWEAAVDGMAARLVRADYLFRAVKVPAGRHRVELRYRPASFTAGAVLSLLALVAWLGAVGAPLPRRSLRKCVLISTGAHK